MKPPRPAQRPRHESACIDMRECNLGRPSTSPTYAHNNNYGSSRTVSSSAFDDRHPTATAPTTSADRAAPLLHGPGAALQPQVPNGVTVGLDGVDSCRSGGAWLRLKLVSATATGLATVALLAVFIAVGLVKTTPFVLAAPAVTFLTTIALVADLKCDELFFDHNARTFRKTTRSIVLPCCTTTVMVEYSHITGCELSRSTTGTSAAQISITRQGRGDVMIGNVSSEDAKAAVALWRAYIERITAPERDVL